VTLLEHQLANKGYSVNVEVRFRKNLRADIVAKKDDEILLIEAKSGKSDAVSVLTNVARYTELPEISAVSLAMPSGQIDTDLVDIARRIGIGIYSVSQSEATLMLEPKRLPRAELSGGASVPTSVVPGKLFDVHFSLAPQYKMATNATIGYLVGDPWFVPKGETNPKTISEIRPGHAEYIAARVGVREDAEPGEYLFFVEAQADGIKSQTQFYRLQVKKESQETVLSEIRSFITVMNGVVNESLPKVLNETERAMLGGVVDIHEHVVSQSIWAEVGNYCLQNGLYRQAQSTYESMLKTIEEWENTRKETLHKGMALYNLGLALYYQGRISESRGYLERAYQEDRRSFGQDRAQGLKAKQALDKLFKD